MVINSVGARKQPNPEHFGQLKNSTQAHFCRSKKRICPGKRGCMVTLLPMGGREMEKWYCFFVVRTSVVHGSGRQPNALDQHVTKLVEPAIASSPNVRRFSVRNRKPPNRLSIKKY